MSVSKSNYVNLILVLIISLIPILHSYDQNIYLSLVKEDGLLEYLTAIFLFLSSLIMILTLLKIKKNHLIFNFGVLLSAVALFFGFGEEISWGQRIFNIESSAFFNKNNLQGEINVHNLMIDGFKFNKLIFTYGLVLLFTFYFFVTPILYKKGFFPKTLINKFSFVVPNYFQSILFLFSTIIINVFDYNKVSELWECSFAVTIFFICLFPLNKKGINLFVNPLL